MLSAVLGGYEEVRDCKRSVLVSSLILLKIHAFRAAD
jgi:hypothetical protein